MAYAINVTNFLNGKVSTNKVLDFVEKKLIEQGKGSMDEDKRRCLYRSPDNCKCAFGHLIPDDKYKPGFDRMGQNGIPYILRHNWQHLGIEKEYYTHDDERVAFLMKLQEIHDASCVGLSKITFADQIKQRFATYRKDLAEAI
jgi:hypothetical protein